MLCQVAVRLTRAESKALTRRRLLDAAPAVFAERGFHGASLEAVSEEAGLTKGAVYSQFESKADLFLAFQEERNAATLRRVQESLAGLDRADKVVPWLPEYWEGRLREGPEWTLLVIEFWATACRDAEILRRFSDQHDRLMSEVGAAFEAAAQRLGAVLPLPGDQLVRASTGIAHGLALERLLAPEKVDARMLELTFAGFAPGRPPARRPNRNGRRQNGRGSGKR
jgi:AcrR family transcriptional regulator